MGGKALMKRLSKRLLSALLAMLMVFGGVAAGAMQVNANEPASTQQEPLPTIEGEEPLSTVVAQSAPSSYTIMSAGTNYTASISPAGTIRYFRFTASSTGTYAFISSGSADAYGYLLDAAGNQITYNDDNGTDRNFRISYSLTQGSVYYLKVKLYSSSATGSFTVRVDLQQAWPPSYTTMNLNTNYSASISTGGAVKYFRFTPSASGTYTFSSTGSSDSCAYLLNSSGSTLAYDDDSGAGTNFSLSYSLTGGSTYYLLVRMYSSSATGSFTVTVTTAWPPLYTTMVANSNYTANITMAGDAKYYRFTPTVSGTHVFTSTGSADPYGYLLNSSGTQLACNDDYNGRNFQISYNLTANQVYYLKVRHYGSTTTGSFNVSVATPTPSWPPSPCTTMSLSSSYTANITTAGDSKWFSFRPSTSGTYYFESAGSVDPYGYLYNASRSLLASNDDYSGRNFRVSYNLTANTTYYLNARLYSNTATGSFTVSVKTPTVRVTFNPMGGTVSPTYKDVTPGDTYGTLPTPTPAVSSGLSFLGWFTSPTGGTRITSSSYVSAYATDHPLYAQWGWPPASYTTISAGSSYTANITPAGKVLYYRFTPSSTGIYNFTSTGSLDSYAYLLDANGNQLTYNDDGGSNYNFLISYNLTSGTTYYLKVKLYSSSVTGSFTVSVASPTPSSYAVTYYANATGVTNMPSPNPQTKTHGTTYYISSTVPQLSGRSFLGWATTDSGPVAYQPGNPYTTNANLPLYAVWSSATPTLLLTQSDIYSFNNSGSNFNTRYNILDRDFNRLKTYVNNYYGASSTYAKNTISAMESNRYYETWGGSCYGMAATAMLHKQNKINVRGNFGGGASSLWNCAKPVNSTSMESVINYYQVSQNGYYGFTRPNAVSTTDSNWSSTLQQIVNDAKAGKLILFSYFGLFHNYNTGGHSSGGHAIVIVGYRQNANGSHDLICWNNWTTDFTYIVNISADYKTCRYNCQAGHSQTATKVEFLSNLAMLDRIDIDGPNNNMTFSAATAEAIPNTTSITIPMGTSISITNEAGETLFFDTETGEATGDIEVLSQHMIVNSTADGNPAPADIVIEIPNSSSFVFSTEGGIDVSVVNSGIFASASSEQADTVVISNDEGVFVIGNGAMDYTVSLGVNSSLCDMVSMTGSANTGASLEFKDGDVIAGGVFGTTMMTVFSSEGEDSVVQEIEFEALASSILVTSAADGSGNIDLMIDSTMSGTFDTSITDSGEKADKAALATALENAKAIEQGNYTDSSYKNLSDAIAAAQEIASKVDAGQSEVNAATSAVNAAISGLVQNPLPDKTALNNAIAEAKAIAKGNYTDESYQALQNAIAAAEAVVADTAATQQQVTEALTALASARSNLQTKTIGKPTANGSTSVTVDYKGSATLSVTGTGITWSGGNNYISVDQNGRVTSLKNFSKTGSATIRATNSAGYVEFNVKVKPTFGQWLMIIFLFGWIWM